MFYLIAQRIHIIHKEPYAQSAQIIIKMCVYRLLLKLDWARHWNKPALVSLQKAGEQD